MIMQLVLTTQKAVLKKILPESACEMRAL